MSIISEALKKANAERHHAPSTSASTRGSSVKPWFSSLLILAILVLPFVLPRFLNRGESSHAESVASITTTAPAPLVMADKITDTSAAGLAQTSIESRGIPAPSSFMPAAISAYTQTAATPQKIGRHIQGIVWTANKGYYAILDGEVIRVGSLVGGMRVTHISPAGVELSNGSETLFIEKSF